MCTLVVAANVVPRYPLVIIANRDEQKERASSPPRRWPGFIAPRDEVAGGTWLGWNDHQVFVGITNRYPGADGTGSTRDPARRSRGALVIDALAGKSAREIHELMAKIDPRHYNGFHLVYADRHDVLATIADGRSLSQLTLGGQGLSLATERSFGAGSRGDDDKARTKKILTRWETIPKDPFAIDQATKLLTEHDDADPLGATCIHIDAFRYGTRSAMVLTLSETGQADMLWAEGPPCTTPFTKVLM